MKIGFIITGRMKSTRLPKKLTLLLNGRQLIKWMIDRAKLVFDSENIIIATSTNPQDDILERIADEESIKVFRGSEDDVVERLYYAALKNNLDYLINITADCPLFGFDYIERYKELIDKYQPDLITGLDLPHGFFVYAIKTDSFRRVIELKKTSETEVWGDYFYSNPDKFNVIKLPVSDEEKRNYRLTVDYPEDFMVFEEIFKNFGDSTYMTSSKDIVHFLDANPKISELNSDCKQKYSDRWNSQLATKIEKK